MYIACFDNCCTITSHWHVNEIGSAHTKKKKKEVYSVSIKYCYSASLLLRHKKRLGAVAGGVFPLLVFGFKF